MSQTVRETMSEAAGQAMSAAGEAASSKDRASRDGFNWFTAIAMGLFHVGAIAALFFFTWKAFFVAIFLWWIQDAEVGGVFPDRLRHPGARRRADFLGGDPPDSPSVFRRGRRSALAH